MFPSYFLCLQGCFERHRGVGLLTRYHLDIRIALVVGRNGCFTIFIHNLQRFSRGLYLHIPLLAAQQGKIIHKFCTESIDVFVVGTQVRIELKDFQVGKKECRASFS